MMAEHHESLDPDNLPVGTAVGGGRFVIEACLGQGGVATVYRVRTVDGRRVALKLMVTKRAADGDQRERFDNEWRIGQALRGLRYVVSVEESGRHDDGRPFFTMELLEGPTLADLIADRQLTVARACWIAREVADALDDLHTRGVVHRDIKPDNVMVTPEGIRLLDFGYAYTRGSEQVPHGGVLTSSEHRPGTLLYMAPEQVDGAPTAPSFDIYALAATLHEALVGHAPYSDLPQLMLVVHKTRGAEGEPSIDGRMVGLRKGLVQLVDQGLQRRPAERVKSAAEFRERLDAVLEEMGDEDFPAGAPGRPVVAAGMLEDGDGDKTIAFLPRHRRVAEPPTERAREVPLRPAIGGGRGETGPVPAAVAVDADRTLDGLEIPEDLQVEAVDAGVDEKAELLALREAARRAAERERAASARVETEAAASPTQVPAELLALRDAVRRAEQVAAQARQRMEQTMPPDVAQAIVSGGMELPPAVREATLAYVAAQRAAGEVNERMMLAERDWGVRLYAAKRREEAAAKAEAERREAEATAKAGAEAAEREREAGAKAKATKKWLGAAVVVLLLGGGVWWGLAGEPERDEDTSPAAVGVRPEPGKQPEAAVEPEPEIETTPEPGPGPEPELEPELEPEPIPEPEIGPEPQPTRKPKPTRKPPVPEPTPEPCTDVAAEAKAAGRDKQWSRVLKLTKSPRCWDDDGMRVRLRVQALSELGRFAECAALGPSSRNPEAKRLAKSCATQLEQEKTP